MSDSDGVLLPHGGYEHLRSYAVAEAVYDATVVFCDRFIDKRSRTHDQMVQAARSGVRNISEGSGAAATSRKTEIKLTNVARASLSWKFVARAAPELAANAMLCAANQAAYLLRRQLESQSRDFVEHGGFTERLYAARAKAKEAGKSDKSDRSDSPVCPLCGKAMRRRTAKQGPHAGQAFWGCSGYPKCKGTRKMSDQSDKSDGSDRTDQGASL